MIIFNDLERFFYRAVQKFSSGDKSISVDSLLIAQRLVKKNTGQQGLIAKGIQGEIVKELLQIGGNI